MEPTVETLILHPAVLIASGFESITSSQVRFLNAHRQHFHTNLLDPNEIQNLDPRHYELGGILNPYGYIQDCRVAFQASADEIKDFPFLSRRAILKHFYADDMNTIWSELMFELFSDLSFFCVEHKKSRDYFCASTKLIHELYPYPIYHKISALHLCGLGAKLLDSFSYVFVQFKIYDARRVQPVSTHE